MLARAAAAASLRAVTTWGCGFCISRMDVRHAQLTLHQQRSICAASCVEACVEACRYFSCQVLLRVKRCLPGLTWSRIDRSWPWASARLGLFASSCWRVSTAACRGPDVKHEGTGAGVLGAPNGLVGMAVEPFRGVDCMSCAAQSAMVPVKDRALPTGAGDGERGAGREATSWSRDPAVSTSSPATHATPPWWTTTGLPPLRCDGVAGRARRRSRMLSASLSPAASQRRKVVGSASAAANGHARSGVDPR